MPAGLASLLLQMQAALTIAVAFVWLRERPPPHQWTGLAIALAGTGVIITDVAGGTTLLPVLLTLAAATAWSLANLALKRMGPADALGIAVWTSILPGPVMLLASIVFEGPSALPSALAQASALGWLAILYLAYPISLLSGALWALLFARYPVATVAPFALLVPLIGFASGWLVYGETMSGRMFIGAAVVLAGLAISIAGGSLWSRRDQSSTARTT
jgi:O-acetylserine/cysteine efflux transporter